MKKKQLKEEKLTHKIKEHTVFAFAYEENLRNVAIVLALSGYFIKVHRENSSYILTVYKSE